MSIAGRELLVVVRANCKRCQHLGYRCRLSHTQRTFRHAAARSAITVHDGSNERLARRELRKFDCRMSLQHLALRNGRGRSGDIRNWHQNWSPHDSGTRIDQCFRTEGRISCVKI